MRLKDLFNSDLTPNWEKYNNLFPEMATCKHSNYYHKEGSPLEHTRLVTNKMFEFVSCLIGKDDERYIMLMASAMLHDIGKPSTTYWDEQKQDWCCKSHGEAGERLFRDMFFEEELDLREKVAYLIRYHMQLHYILLKKKETQEEEIKQILNSPVLFQDMLLLNECDLRGSINDENTEGNIVKHINNIINLKNNVNFTNSKPSSNDTPTMYVMIGVPGAGKTTYAKNIRENNIALPIVSRDITRIKLGICKDGEKAVGTNEEEKKVSVKVNEEINEYLSKQKSFIIDNTSLKKKYREGYRLMAKKHNFRLVFVYIEAPTLNENIIRREKEIDPEVIKRMWNNFEFPQKFECDELWMVSQKHNKTWKF